MTRAEHATRELVLVRHAKSAWPDLPDRDRPLAPRGRRQAPLVGKWLRAGGCLPDLVLCSTARRARETWQLMAVELGAPVHVTHEERIYGADAVSLLDLIRQVPEEVRTLLLVGHAPGIPDLTLLLAGDRRAVSAGNKAGNSAGNSAGDAAGDVLRRASGKFPTAGVAVLAIAGAWSALEPGRAQLTDFTVPRDLES